MQKIGDVQVKCPKCGWTGTVDAMEPDVNGEGDLGCPVCLAVVEVHIG